MSKVYRKIQASQPTVQARLALPFSKSESNRALIMQALAQFQSGARIEIAQCATARDTQTLQALLATPSPVWDVLDAGTTMRFLLAYAAITGQHKILTGTPRMQKRPIGILVEALRTLGFDIQYLGQEGYPPLEVKGKAHFEQKTAALSIRGDVSSQFISALLMIAPLLPQGLRLHLQGEIGSRPYIEMTRLQMQYFGIASEWQGAHLWVGPQTYQARAYQVEADWSAASYWYSVAALSPGSNLFLEGLRADSLQGDAQVAEFGKSLGVETTFFPEGVALRHLPTTLPAPIKIDFRPCPDLAQTWVVLCAALQVPLMAQGLESLRLKETDRIRALQNELLKLGVSFSEEAGYWVLGFGEWANAPAPARPLVIETYEDHRMAMAFAPLALRQTLYIAEPQVVQKSYPHFWADCQEAGLIWEDVAAPPQW
ncbi:MAG: 3-phosphoshikimate 1-carboxyvinyltransferase [Microscillaceae bacterium]